MNPTGRRHSLGALLLLAIASSAAAQSPARPDADAGATEPVRAVEIRRLPVFAGAEADFWLYRLMNGLHVVTRPYVVRRELLVAPGEPYDTARANETERNLRALGIFRDVDVDSATTDSGLVVRVTTADGWTTAPSFSVKTSGRQRAFSFFLSERNLLGTATVATVGYASDPDRSSIVLGFDTPRFIANTIGVGALYTDYSDGRAGWASLRYPFLNLASRRGAGLSGQLVDRRVLRYVDGRARPVESLRRKFGLLRTDAAVALAASRHGYTHIGLTAQLRREDYAPDGSTMPLPRTVTAALGPYVAARAVDYIQVRNFQAMGRAEDIDLGPRVRAGLLIAPRQWGYERFGVGASVSAAIGRLFPASAGFALLQASASGLRSSEGFDSATVEASSTVVLYRGRYHLFVGHATVGFLENPYPGGEFDLGFGYAVRAFPVHAFTGDRQYLLNAEYRWLAWPRVLDLVGVGVAAFVDHAGAWYTGSPRRSGTNVGVGLRLGSLRSAEPAFGRLDLAYRFRNDAHPAGWVVSLGKGFVFQRF